MLFTINVEWKGNGIINGNVRADYHYLSENVPSFSVMHLFGTAERNPFTVYVELFILS